MTKVKFFILLAVIISVCIYILKLHHDIGSLKDEVISLKEFKNKKEVEYFALKNSYENLIISSNKQNEEIKRLEFDNKSFIKRIEEYKKKSDEEKYKKPVVKILKQNSDECNSLLIKLNEIGKLNYKDL